MVFRTLYSNRKRPSVENAEVLLQFLLCCPSCESRIDGVMQVVSETTVAKMQMIVKFVVIYWSYDMVCWCL
jgi:hypothetical protein